jgi:hypothetical protein
MKPVGVAAVTPLIVVNHVPRLAEETLVPEVEETVLVRGWSVSASAAGDIARAVAIATNANASLFICTSGVCPRGRFC